MCLKKVKNFYIWLGKGEGVLPFYKEFIKRKATYGQANEEDFLLVDKNVMHSLKKEIDEESGKTIHKRLTSASIIPLLDKEVIKGAIERNGKQQIKTIKAAYKLLMKLEQYAFASDCLHILYIQNTLHKKGDVVVFRDADIKCNGPIIPEVMENMIFGMRFVSMRESRKTGRHRLISHQGLGKLFRRFFPLGEGNTGIINDLFVAEVGSPAANVATLSLSQATRNLLESPFVLRNNYYFYLSDFLTLRSHADNLLPWAEIDIYRALTQIVERVANDVLHDIFVSSKAYTDDLKTLGKESRVDTTSALQSPTEHEHMSETAENLRRFSISNYRSIDEFANQKSSVCHFFDIHLDPRELRVCSQKNNFSWDLQMTDHSNQDLHVSDYDSDCEPELNSSKSFTLPQSKVDKELEAIGRIRGDFVTKCGFLESNRPAYNYTPNVHSKRQPIIDGKKNLVDVLFAENIKVNPSYGSSHRWSETETTRANNKKQDNAKCFSFKLCCFIMCWTLTLIHDLS